MATYVELHAEFGNETLIAKVEVAVLIAADTLLGDTPDDSDRKWASAVYENPRREALKAWKALLAANNGATLANILASTDATIQTAVDAIAPALVVAFNA